MDLLSLKRNFVTQQEISILSGIFKSYSFIPQLFLTHLLIIKEGVIWSQSEGGRQAWPACCPPVRASCRASCATFQFPCFLWRDPPLILAKLELLFVNLYRHVHLTGRYKTPSKVYGCLFDPLLLSDRSAQKLTDVGIWGSTTCWVPVLFHTTPLFPKHV